MNNCLYWRFDHVGENPDYIRGDIPSLDVGGAVNAVHNALSGGEGADVLPVAPGRDCRLS